MTVDETRLRIADMTAEHYRNGEEWQREQANRVADTLQQVIEITGFQPGPPYDYPLFRSLYSVPRLLDHIRALAASAADQPEPPRTS